MTSDTSMQSKPSSPCITSKQTRTDKRYHCTRIIIYTRSPTCPQDSHFLSQSEQTKTHPMAQVKACPAKTVLEKAGNAREDRAQKTRRRPQGAGLTVGGRGEIGRHAGFRLQFLRESRFNSVASLLLFLSFLLYLADFARSSGASCLESHLSGRQILPPRL
jgi:hypothetical protein